jgi:DNA-directed RNA polymerase subunit RPC12/RpoP
MLTIYEVNMKRETLEMLSARAFCGLPASGPNIPPMYEAIYKCTRCSHEWNDIHVGYNPVEDTQDCKMGCSNGYNELSLLGLYKTIKGLITGREPFGHGRLIKKEEL